MTEETDYMTEITEAQRTSQKIHPNYPAIPGVPVLLLSDIDQKKRVEKLKKYIKYRLLYFSTHALYAIPDDLQLMIDDYFNNIPTNKIVTKSKEIEVKAITYSGMLLHCGFNDRGTWNRYGRDERYEQVIKSARERIEQHYESYLLSGASPIGAIFALKNIANWQDKTIQDVNQTIKEIKIILPDQSEADKINQL